MPPTDPKAAHHGLPDALRIPIAGKSREAIEQFVGPVLRERGRVRGEVGAYFVDSTDRPELGGVGLWNHPDAGEYAERLFPDRQVWVHVDYTRYRDAYISFGMPEIPDGHVLDHIQNRKAIRLRDYSHPYIRLCPVTHRVNTSGGVNAGAEGMERAHMQSAKYGNQAAIDAIERVNKQSVIYADPLDITKMLNIVPGTFVLDGVREILHLLYP